MSSGPRCETVGIASRQLSVARLCTLVICIVFAPVPADCQLVYGTRACFLKILQHLVVSVQAISAHGKVVLLIIHSTSLCHDPVIRYSVAPVPWREDN